ncbi:MAG: BatA domain-containing protein [Gemmataceae bacterium]
MSFSAPWLLLGSLAVSVPLILHFFYRARYRKQPWAAMTFLKLAIEQTSRRLRFQEWVLLALRCAVLLLLAFALARPSFRGVLSGGRGEAIDAILVFDVSYSMTARDGEKNRLERAKDAAISVIDNLPSNSTVQILRVADRASLLGPQSPGNLDQARQLVLNLEPTSLATDLLPGLVEAHAALDRGAGTNKEVYLFGDLQKTGWERQTAALRAKAEEIRQRATLLVVECGNAAVPKNVSIVDITYPSGIPHTGVRMPFTVLLRNTGAEAVRNLSVTLEVDGTQTEKERPVVEEIGPGQLFPVTLTGKLDDAGTRILTAKLTGDDVPGDNRLDRTIAVRDQLRVLIVDGDPDVRDPKQSASHYVRNALLPVPENLRDDYFVKVTVVPADEAGPALLGVCDVCYLLNVPSSNADHPGIPGLSVDFVNRLAEFVKTGGGLVIGCGPNIIPGRYNAVLGSGGAKLLPADIEEAFSTKPEAPFKLAPDTGDSFLTRFRDEPFKSVTAEAEVLKLVGVMNTKVPECRVLLRLVDGKPVISARTIGLGEVFFVGTTLDDDWGNWTAKAGSFVSFIQFGLAHLTGKNQVGSNRVAGETLTRAVTDGNRAYELIRPNSGSPRLKLGRPSGGADTRLTISTTETFLAGPYRIVGDGEDDKQGALFAVAPDVREADQLGAMTPTELEQLLGFKPVFLKAGTGSEQSIQVERSYREWTIWALLLVFAFAVGESFWAWMCGRAW